MRLILGDCLEIMKTLPDKSIDAVITDPPYGNNLKYNSYEDSRENLSGLVPKFMKECLRISDMVVITPGVANIYLYPESSWILCWVNMAGIGSSRWGFCCWQPILVYGKCPYLSTGKGRRHDTYIQEGNEVEKSDHPCPKPTNVMRWIIKRTMIEPGTILDPFMGSGTTGVAAIDMGHDFIGIEIDPGYYSISERRIKDAQAQGKLFGK